MSGVVFFFFKQKTAYEMRISDWSSDVCSSDLAEDQHRALRLFQDLRESSIPFGNRGQRLRPGAEVVVGIGKVDRLADQADAEVALQEALAQPGVHRSEEHTSELQSLIRITYAVFCLKKIQRNMRAWLRKPMGRCDEQPYDLHQLITHEEHVS